MGDKLRLALIKQTIQKCAAVGRVARTEIE